MKKKLVAASAVRDRADLKRRIAIIFGRGMPKEMSTEDLDAAVGEFIDEAQKAIAVFVALKPTGRPMPSVTIALLRKIVRSTERWHRQLTHSRPPISLPQLTALRLAADRKAKVYARRRGKSADSVRFGLIGDLFDAYTTACPWGRRGFQPAANVMLASAGLTSITKHELAKLQAQIAEFDSADR